jgi:hypothetical protein
MIGCPGVMGFKAFLANPAFNCGFSYYLRSLLIITFVMFALANLSGIESRLVLGSMNLTAVPCVSEHPTI